MLVIPARVKVVVVMVSALALAAGLLTLTLLAKPAQAQAQTVTFNDRTPISSVFLHPCTGEFIPVEGTLHVVVHRTLDAGGGFHFKGHGNSQVHGESASGAKYVSHVTDQIHDKFNAFSESAQTFTIPRTVQFIRQGSETAGDDFQVKVLIHITINANGELTSEVFQSEAECK